MVNQLLLLSLAGALSLLFIFTLTWLFQLKTKNAAIVDAVWAASFPLLAAIYFLQANSFTLRYALLLLMVFIWGMRLSVHLLIRTLGHEEDVRYTALRKQWGRKQHWFMLRFFYFQAILALILSLPFALVANNLSPNIKMVEWVGVSVWFIAVIGESIADAQLKKFKSNPANRGKVCQTGLWNYSRHPNYFFEWLVWVAYFLFAVASPWGWLSILSPVLILYFLLKVTGIPYTEVQMIKSRGQAFIDYQKTTSAFVPLPKRIQKSLTIDKLKID